MPTARWPFRTQHVGGGASARIGTWTRRRQHWKPELCVLVRPRSSSSWSVPGGIVMPVSGMTPDQAWFLVSSPFGAGWVDWQRLSCSGGSIASVPIYDY